MRFFILFFRSFGYHYHRHYFWTFSFALWLYKTQKKGEIIRANKFGNIRNSRILLNFVKDTRAKVDIIKLSSHDYHDQIEVVVVVVGVDQFFVGPSPSDHRWIVEMNFSQNSRRHYECEKVKYDDYIDNNKQKKTKFIDTFFYTNNLPSSS